MFSREERFPILKELINSLTFFEMEFTSSNSDGRFKIMLFFLHSGEL
jgi:hypothetical protein